MTLGGGRTGEGDERRLFRREENEGEEGIVVVEEVGVGISPETTRRETFFQGKY